MALINEGLSYAAIGRQLGFSKTAAYRAFQRGMALIKAETAELAREYLYRHLAENDADRHLVVEKLMGDYVVTSNGQVVKLGGEPLDDPMPVLAAVDRMLKIRDQEARLLRIGAANVDFGGSAVLRIIGVPDDSITGAILGKP